jgi:hypothetical protein
MFHSGRKREADITLCLFPHLREFIAIDVRDELPDGPAVRLLSLDDVFTAEFRKSLETGFAQLVSDESPGLMDMIGLPQEVEAMVRAESLKRIIRSLNESAGARMPVTPGGIGALFFARGLLAIHREQLETAMHELFAASLTPGQLDMLTAELRRLIEEEKSAEESARQNEMASLITGRGDSFMTIWESGNGGA